MPPACAMAIAILASVTVSIAEATIGMLSAMPRVMRERISTSEGSTSERPGFSSTSSNVKASGGAELSILAITNPFRPEGPLRRVERINRICCEEPASRAPTRGPHLGWRRSVARERSNSKTVRELFPGFTTPKTRRQHVKLGRIRATGRRFDMLNACKIALERREQRGLGAALDHLGEKGAAGLEHLGGKLGRGLDQRHDLEMVGLAMSGGVRGHVGQDHVGRTAEHGLEAVGRGSIEEVDAGKLDSRHLVHRQNVDRDHAP